MGPQRHAATLGAHIDSQLTAGLLGWNLALAPVYLLHADALNSFGFRCSCSHPAVGVAGTEVRATAGSGVGFLPFLHAKTLPLPAHEGEDDPLHC